MPRKKTEPKPEKTAFVKKVEEVIGREVYDDQLKVQWTTGGITGGSCYGDAPDQAVEAEKEPEFEDLDKILEVICPSITFLQYKSLLKSVVQESSYEENCYYGNYYLRSVKKINLNNLEQYLREKGLCL